MSILQLWFIIFIGIILALIVAGIFLLTISNSQCHKLCDKKGFSDYEIHESGNFKLDDLCICIKGNETKSFRMGI